MTNKNVGPEVLAIREAFSEFEVFGDAVWKAINLPPLTDRQREIAKFLQYGPQRGFIAAFRGIGKSYLAACYALWCLLQNYDEQILILSGSSQRSVDSSLWVRSLLENPRLPFLHHLRPGASQRDSKLSWDIGPATTQHSASFAAMSVGGSIQGRRCTKAILDDAEQANNSASQLQRETLLRNVMDVEAMLVPDTDSKIVVLGTFQSLNSIYNDMTGTRGYEAIYIPARVPDSDDEYVGRLADGVKEIKKLINSENISDHSKALWTILSHTGLRPVEASRVEPKHVVKHGKNWFLMLPACKQKYKRHDAIGLTEEEAKMIKKYCPLIKGDYKKLYRLLRSDMKKAGIPINQNGVARTPYNLRSFFITELLRNKVDIETVRVLARHSDIKTTLTHYARFNQEEIADTRKNLINLKEI